MPEETTTPAPEAAPAEPAKTPEEKTVPYDRFAQVNGQAQEAKKKLEEMQARLQEIEDRDKTELERERSQRERLEAELQDRETRLVRVERGSWVRDAAMDANFIDPADALGRIDLSEIESATEARRAVKKIAEEAKHLIRQEAPRPEIGQVVRDGQPVTAANPATVDEESEKFLEELRAASRSGWSSSGAGLLD